MDQRETRTAARNDPITETTVEQYLGPLGDQVELEGTDQVEEPLSTLVGFNVAPYFEPMDQSAMVVGARRLQEFNEDHFDVPGTQVPVVCGAFRALNQEGPEEAMEWTAEGEFRAGVNAARYEEMADTMGLNLPDRGVVTDTDVLERQDFWDAMYERTRNGDYASFDEIRRRTTEHHVPEDRLGEKIAVRDLGTVFDEVFDVDTRLDEMADDHDVGGEMRGPELYTLLESAVFEAAADIVSEGSDHTINGKLGPSKEQLYDDLMDLHSVRVAQPAGFDWDPVDPYIAWDDDRVFFLDSERRMDERFAEAPEGVTRTAEWGRMWNPVVYTVGTAVEAARYMDDADPAAMTGSVYGRALTSFEDVASYAKEEGVEALADGAAATVAPVTRAWAVPADAYGGAAERAYGPGASAVVEDGREFLARVSRGQGQPAVSSDRIEELEQELQDAIQRLQDADGRPPQDAIDTKNRAGDELDYEQRRELFRRIGIDAEFDADAGVDAEAYPAGEVVRAVYQAPHHLDGDAAGRAQEILYGP